MYTSEFYMSTMIQHYPQARPALGIGKLGSRLGPPISLIISGGLTQESFHIYF